jgi:hypothetical protein
MGSKRAWKSFVCKTVSVKSAAADVAIKAVIAATVAKNLFIFSS